MVVSGKNGNVNKVLWWEWVGMGMGMTSWEWEGMGTAKVIPAHIYRSHSLRHISQTSPHRVVIKTIQLNKREYKYRQYITYTIYKTRYIR